VIVTFEEGAGLEGARRVARGHGLELAKHFQWLSEHDHKVYVLLRSKGASTEGLIADLVKEPVVIRAEPNYLRWTLDMAAPNDPLFGQLWGLQNTGQAVQGLSGTAHDDIGFLKAWGLARPLTDELVVAVIDTGIDPTHADLAMNLWTNRGEIGGNGVDDDGNGYVDDVHGYDFANGTSDISDSGLHGTHVSGTVAAVGNNGVGVVGVCFPAHVMVLKASNDGSSFTDSAIIDALQYATMMKGRGVNIVSINASFGGGGYNSTEASAIQAAGNAGIVFCAAAGNSSQNHDTTSSYPASYRLSNMIVVAASTQSDQLASFSDYGATTVDLAAPGVSVLSTIPTWQAGTTAYVQQGSTTYAANQLTYSGLTSGIMGTIYDCGLGYPTNFPPAVSGNIALIQRGTLHFSDKVSNAMAAGARAAIIYNNVAGNFNGTLQTVSGWIPAISLSQADGQALQALTPVPGTVVNAVDPAQVYEFLDGTSMATPHVTAAVAFAALNFPTETVAQRIQRILNNVTVVPGLQGWVITGGRLNLAKIVDTDGNGLPDWWEQAWFGHSTGTDPLADPDHDGANNLQEFIADTNPTNASSVLRLSSVSRRTNGMSVNWMGGIQARQYLQRTSTPGDPGSWINLRTNLAPTAVTNSFVDTTATNAANFYRVQVSRP
jgi:subtilisin family serine protease